MTRALGSSWPCSAPCRAQVGSAWCRLCQDSPNDAIASHDTFRDLSRTSNSSLPKVWQMELMAQVTWCSSATRTRLPQKKAVTAPCQDIPHRPPISEQVGGELLLRGLVRVEEPADVRVNQALGQRLPVLSVPPGRMRVAFLVAVLVVPAVIRHPGDHRSLDGQGARDRHRDPEAGLRLERPVREVSVEADRNAQPGHPVEDQRDQ